jgi:hypothetical protein
MPLGNAEFHVTSEKQTLYEIQNLDAEYGHILCQTFYMKLRSVVFYGFVCCTRVLSMEMLML